MRLVITPYDSCRPMSYASYRPSQSGDSMSDWRTLYSVVLQLQDRSALKRESILDAEAAILQRSKDLHHAADCEEERKEMVEAITVLKFLKRRNASQNLNSKQGVSL
jgi:hypothetical protein